MYTRETLYRDASANAGIAPLTRTDPMKVVAAARPGSDATTMTAASPSAPIRVPRPMSRSSRSGGVSSRTGPGDRQPRDARRLRGSDPDHEIGADEVSRAASTARARVHFSCGGLAPHRTAAVRPGMSGWASNRS